MAALTNPTPTNTTSTNQSNANDILVSFRRSDFKNAEDFRLITSLPETENKVLKLTLVTVVDATPLSIAGIRFLINGNLLGDEICSLIYALGYSLDNLLCEEKTVIVGKPYFIVNVTNFPFNEFIYSVVLIKGDIQTTIYKDNVIDVINNAMNETYRDKLDLIKINAEYINAIDDDSNHISAKDNTVSNNRGKTLHFSFHNKFILELFDKNITDEEVKYKKFSDSDMQKIYVAFCEELNRLIIKHNLKPNADIDSILLSDLMSELNTEDQDAPPTPPPIAPTAPTAPTQGEFDMQPSPRCLIESRFTKAYAAEDTDDEC